MNCGKHVQFGRHSKFYYENMIVGDYVTIGDNSLFMSSKARIIIGDHVMFGPHVIVITGDHRIDLPNRTMDTIKENEKLGVNDQDVIFAGDNWIGAGAIILKGVHIGKGSVIGAGSVVTKNCDEYSVYAGNPARKIKTRFNEALK